MPLTKKKPSTAPSTQNVLEVLGSIQSHIDTTPSILLKDGEYVSVGKKKKENYGVFQAIGRLDNIYTINDKPAKSDIFGLLRNVSKPAYAVFDDLKRNRNPYTNLARYYPKDLTKSQRVMLNRYLAELRDQDIVRKAKTTNLAHPVAKYTYMINPYLLMCPEYKSAVEMWNLL